MRAILLFAALFLVGCHRTAQEGGHSHGHDQKAEDPRPGLSFTDWTDDTELFMEVRALVRGIDSPCGAHVTRLKDFSALGAGKVTVILRGGPSEERFVGDKASPPGIFRPVARPATSGKRQLVVTIEGDGFQSQHDLGEVVVYDSVEAAVAAIPEEAAPPGRITFLKEQQWPIEFGTAPAALRTLRPTIRASGILRARADGEVVVAAPATGRMLAPPGGFPVVGATLKVDQPLATLAPRLEASDLASLELAVTSSRLELRYAQREHQRMEALKNEGAVPERRVLDAAHAEDEARASVAAAERRIGQFRGVQRTQGTNSEGGVRVRAPLAGTLVQVETAPGAFVESGSPLFRVVDLARLWLEVRVAEADVEKVHTYRGAWFSLDGYDQPFDVGPDALIGRSQRIDPVTRTMSLVVAVDNPDAKLAVGSFARVNVIIDEPQTALAVPWTAVVDDNGQSVVFVQVEGEAFERRIVRLGVRDRDQVGILAGVKADEHVVVKGAWSVKLAASSGSIPAHGHSH
jgi:membrane fusion protein, heavy metal efflux system